jgi:hypothetical protein
VARDEVREAIERCLAALRGDAETHLGALADDLLQLGGDENPISRLVTAMRRLDAATTLHGVLDVVAECAAAEAARLAVLLVDDGRVLVHRHFGFPAEAAPAETSLDAAPALLSAVNLRHGTVVPATSDRDHRTPAFLRVRPGHTGLVLPLLVERSAVALIYSEGPGRQAGESGAPAWGEHIEVLVRHASARLESVTSRRTLEVLATSS